MKTIAIIGGGFSGTLAAVNLACLADNPVRIVVINFGNPIGRGVAYGTKQIEHLLNVPAGNMSAFPDQPFHFVEWLNSCKEPNIPWAELERSLFAQNLRRLFAIAPILAYEKSQPSSLFGGIRSR